MKKIIRFAFAVSLIVCMFVLMACVTFGTQISPPQISHEYDDYYVALVFSYGEPSFVYVYVNGENWYGGLWGVIDGVRTIDFHVYHNPRLYGHEEITISDSQMRAITNLDIGSRTVDFQSNKNVLTLRTTYLLAKSVIVTDFYWEQINIHGVDKNATVAIGYANGLVKHCTWGVADFEDVVWVWLRYRQWLSPYLIRQILFITGQPATAQLREEHGNDVLFTRTHANATFTTEIHFDVSCPL